MLCRFGLVLTISLAFVGSIDSAVGLRSVLAQSAPSPGNTSPQKPPVLPKIVLDLGLSPEQVKQLEDIRIQSGSQLDQVDRELSKADQELEVLMNSATATDSQIREKYGQVVTLRQKLSELTFESRLAMRAVLTPDQRLAFEQQLLRLQSSYRKRVEGGRVLQK